MYPTQITTKPYNFIMVKYDPDGKEFACNSGHLGSIPELGRSPGEGNGNPIHYSCLVNHHGQKSLAGYSPWDLQESDMTE